MYCSKCGQQTDDESKFCPECGIPQNPKKNPCAMWGLLCALVGIMLPIPIIDIIFSAIGMVLSIIAVRHAKLRGAAVAGIVVGAIGFIGAIMLLAVHPDFYSGIWDLVGGLEF